MPHFTANDGPIIAQLGDKMKKKLSPVYMVQQDLPGTVETNEGTLSFNAGDFIAHDEKSGHVWPVSAEYVEQHYDVWTDEDDQTYASMQEDDDEADAV